MASPITFGGLASGLDTKAIVAALVGVEGRKVDLLRNQRALFQRRIDAYADLGKKLSALQDALGKIGEPDELLAHSAKLPDGADQNLVVTPRGSAQVGAYQIEISAVAQSTFLRSDGQADANADLAITGTLSLQVGTTQHDITIDGTNNSLNGIRDAINDADVGVVATVVFDGTDYHLEMRGKDTGLANAVTVLAEPTLPPPQGGVLNLAQLRAASDAAFTIDGQAYTSADNTVDDAIQGVTLQLLDEQAVGAAPIQLTISEDFAAIEERLKGFVDAYNDVIDFLNGQSKARADSSEAVKPLAGESALRGLRSTLGTTVSGAAAVPGGFPSLASIGISSQSDGRLKLDSTKLSAALADDLDGIRRMLTDETEGIGQKLLAAVEARTDSIDGIVKLRKDAFQLSIATIDKRITRAEDALVQFEQGLVRKYAQLETLVGRLQQQGQALGGIVTGTTSSRR